MAVNTAYTKVCLTAALVSLCPTVFDLCLGSSVGVDGALHAKALAGIPKLGHHKDTWGVLRPILEGRDTDISAV